jgi:antitoxin YqcF
MSPVAESGRAVARAASEAFGGKPQVRRYYDEAEKHSVDMLTCEGAPTADLVTYSTVSLHGYANMLEQSDVRVEMAGVASRAAGPFVNMLATAAFYVMKDHWLCAPGVVFPSLTRQYKLSPRLEHVLWVPPFPWQKLGSLEVGDGLAVHWLLAVPISEGEREFLLDNGFDAFEAVFAEREVEYFNLERASIF